MKDILKNDALKFDFCEFNAGAKERAIGTLEKFSRFVEYHYENVLTAKDFKTQLLSDGTANKFLFRKSIIECILDCYLKNFYYRCPQYDDFSRKFTNYLKYTVFYENIDIFAFISFFDNFYSLKCCFGIKKENNFLHIEWLLFLSMMSNTFYPKYDHYMN